MAEIITFYNHKGGVGKTTLVQNLAFALADEGQRVLVIDADPQMNLTAALYGLSTAVEYSSEQESKWTEYTQKYISLSEYLNEHLKDDKSSKEMFRKGNIDLISGSITLSEIEADLYGIIKNKNDFTRNIPHRFEQSIREKKKDYDFILIDSSPSASSILNALFVMSADYFILPVTPTFFSLQAVDNMRAIFQNWTTLLGDYQSTIGTKGLSFKPHFLGLVIQMAKRFNNGDVKFSSATETWVSQVNQSIKRFQSFALQRDWSVSEQKFQTVFPDGTPFVIDKCCDFTATLRGIAEKEGLPVIHLTYDICKKNKFRNIKNIENEGNQYHKALKSINESYRGIAKNLLNLKTLKK